MARKDRPKHRPSMTSRVIGYHFEGRIDVPHAERLLARALVAGIVTQYVAKHYADADRVWFNGPPCADLRAVRHAIARIVR